MTEHVSDWPRVSAVVRPDATGEVTTNGISRACAAESIDALRVGMIADVAALAVTMRRPVRLDVAEGPINWRLAVRPNGVVHEVAPDGTIPSADGLLVQQGHCRACRQPQPVTATNCGACGADAPLRVVVAPHADPAGHLPVPDAQAITAASIVAEMPTELPVAPPHLRAPLDVQAAAALHDESESTAARLRLQSPGQPDQIVPGRVALGRNPETIDGRTAVILQNSSRQVSRTHALVDVDAAGRIVVTDHHAGNGVIIEETDTWLEPGTPTVVAEGATLRLGDVFLTVARAA